MENSDFKFPTGYVYDRENKKIKVIHDKFDESFIKEIFEKRLGICKNCQKFSFKDNVYKCNLCSCNLTFKLSCVYPLTPEGKCFKAITPSNSYVYVCNLQKW